MFDDTGEPLGKTELYTRLSINYIWLDKSVDYVAISRQFLRQVC